MRSEITAPAIKAMLRAGKPLSELAACMPRFPQVLENVRVQRKDDLWTLPGVQAQIRQAERALVGPAHDKDRVPELAAQDPHGLEDLVEGEVPVTQVLLRRRRLVERDE